MNYLNQQEPSLPKISFLEDQSVQSWVNFRCQLKSIECFSSYDIFYIIQFVHEKLDFDQFDILCIILEIIVNLFNGLSDSIQYLQCDNPLFDLILNMISLFNSQVYRALKQDHNPYSVLNLMKNFT